MRYVGIDIANSVEGIIELIMKGVTIDPRANDMPAYEWHKYFIKLNNTTLPREYLENAFHAISNGDRIVLHALRECFKNKYYPNYTPYEKVLCGW